MQRLTTCLVILLLAGCQSMATDDPSSVWYRIPPGSVLVLNKSLAIPAGRAHVMLQGGAVVHSASEADVSCRFEVRQLGPRTIKPDNFRIMSYSSQQEWENYPNTKRFYKTLRLESDQQTDIQPMVCAYVDFPVTGRPVSWQEIEAALGDYFTLKPGQ